MMQAQAVRIPLRPRRARRIQSSAFEQCSKGCSFSDVQLDCIKYLKLWDELGYDVELTYKKKQEGKE